MDGAAARRTATPRRAGRVGLAVVLLCLGLEVPAMSDQRDPRLDSLFAKLAAAPGAEEATAVEREIWAIWFDPGDPEVDATMRKGVAAMERGDAGTAMAAFDAVIAARPDFAEGWNRRATLYYLMRRFPESIADIERTVALEPRHFGAWSGLALIRERQEDPFAALEALEHVVRIYPQMPALAERIEHLTRQLGDPI